MMEAAEHAPEHSEHDHGRDDGMVHAHPSSWQFLVGIFFTLIFLTFVTVQVSYFDFGPANIYVAMGVATLKATLVSLFFMHLIHEKPFNALIFVMAFVFLGVFITFTLDDITTRGYIDDANGTVLHTRSGEAAPGGMPAPAAAPAAAGGGHGSAAPAHH